MSGLNWFSFLPGPLAGLLMVSLQATVVAGLIVLVQGAMGRRLAPRWRFALWGIFLARLVLPSPPESGWSVFNLYYVPGRIGSVLTARTSPGNDGPAADSPANESRDVPALGAGEGAGPLSRGGEAGGAVGAGPSSSGADSPAGPGSSRVNAVRHWMAWLPLVWFLGAAALLARMVGESWRFSHRVVRRRLVTDPRVLNLLEDCKEAMKVRAFLAVVETPRVDSPCLFGVVRPRLLLPEGLAATLSNGQLRSVFLHELAHLKRRDVAVNWIMSLLQAIHWFNPAIWAAFSRMRADRELACDALALSCLDHDAAREYGNTLVDLMEQTAASPRRPAALAALVGVVERNARLKERIGWIARNDGVPYSRGAALGLALVLVLGAATLTEARTPDLDWSQTVRAPERNSLVLPTVPEGAGSVPIARARVMAHVFLTEKGGPVAFHEFDILWPDDKGKEFAFRYGKVDVKFKITNVAASTEEPTNTWVDVEERPYLLVECSGDLHRNGLFGGGGATFGGACYGRTNAIGGASVDNLSAAVVLSPASVDDPLVETTLREFVRDRWPEIAGQVWIRPNRSLRLNDNAAAARKIWGEEAGVELPATPGWEAKAAAYQRRLEKAGGRPGGNSSPIYKVGLIDLDTSRTLTFDSPPAEWPEGFDIQHDETTGRLSIRPNSTVRLCRFPATFNEFDDVREARKHLDQLSATPPFPGKGMPLILTDQGRVAILMHGSSGSSGPPFGKRKHFTGFRWIFLNNQKPDMAPSSPSLDPSPVSAPSDSSRKTASESPAPGWRERFDEVYRLDAGEVLKRIEPPFIPERAEYYRSEHKSQAEEVPEPPDYFMFVWKNGAWKNWGYGFGSPGAAVALGDVLRSGLLIPYYEFGGPKDLLDLPVGGDWIRRDGASREGLLKALTSILQKDLGRTIRFERRSVEREVVVVSGTYSFAPDPKAVSSTGVPAKSVYVYSDALNPDVCRGGSGDLSGFIESVGDGTRLPFVDETNSSDASLEWRTDESSWDTALQEDPRRLDLLLANLERQTGLKYRLERRTVDVWFVIEDKR